MKTFIYGIIRLHVYMEYKIINSYLYLESL